MRSFIFTIGHSTRSMDEFVHLLKSHGVQRVVDVRTIPRSRFNPQYDIAKMPGWLGEAGIHYSHLPGLGGLRHSKSDSPNTGWRNKSFRGYADYMSTEEFRDSLERCIGLAAAERVALMCAEAVPWRCHRSLIADALVVRGIDALEIASDARVRPHALTPFARVDGTDITYPPPVDETGQQDLTLAADDPDPSAAAPPSSQPRPARASSRTRQ